MSDPKPLPSGLYNIRPADSHSRPVPGGVYVTGNGLGAPLIMSAQRPPQSERQNWHVSHDEETNQYTITLIEQDGHDRYGFSWYGNITPESRVVLGASQQFIISPDGSDKNSYIIRPKRDVIGVEICVGVDHYNGELNFEFFPVHAPPMPKPRWSFTPLKI